MLSGPTYPKRVQLYCSGAHPLPRRLSSFVLGLKFCSFKENDKLLKLHILYVRS